MFFFQTSSQLVAVDFIQATNALVHHIMECSFRLIHEMTSQHFLWFCLSSFEAFFGLRPKKTGGDVEVRICFCEAEMAI